jgi:Leucine-rich repeat (LRR) protein
VDLVLWRLMQFGVASLAGCSLRGLWDSSGDSPLANLTSLSTLNLSANEVEEVEELSPLGGLKSVVDLRVEDNPCAEEHRCKQFIKQ